MVMARTHRTESWVSALNLEINSLKMINSKLKIQNTNYRKTLSEMLDFFKDAQEKQMEIDLGEWIEIIENAL
jgi:regulator of replication initiation timing